MINRRNRRVKQGGTRRSALQYIKRVVATVTMDNERQAEFKDLLSKATLLRVAYEITDHEVNTLHRDVAAVRLLRILQKAGGTMYAVDLFRSVKERYPDGVSAIETCKQCGYRPDTLIRVTRHAYKNPKNRIFEVVAETHSFGGCHG